MSCSSCGSVSRACRCRSTAKACPTGATGPTGPSGGPTGATGPTGPASGPTGATGPTGPATAATAYTNRYDSNLTTVANGAPLLLATAGPSSQVTNVGGTLTFAVAGLYEVDFNVSVSQSAALNEAVSAQAFLNGSALAQATFSAVLTSLSEQTNFGGSFLVQVAAGDTLQLRNTSGGTRTLRGNLTAVRIGS